MTGQTLNGGNLPEAKKKGKGKALSHKHAKSPLPLGCSWGRRAGEEGGITRVTTCTVHVATRVPAQTWNSTVAKGLCYIFQCRGIAPHIHVDLLP